MRLIDSIGRSSVVRHASSLLGANVVAQAVALAVYPLLTRLFTADDFGLFNLFLSIGGILLLVATGQYEYAVVLPRSHRQGAWCVHAGMVPAVVVVLVALLSLPLAEQIARLFAAPALARVWWLMPIYILVAAAVALCSSWLMRHKRFDRVATYQVDQSLLNAGMKVGGGYFSLHGGLIAASVVAPLVALVITLWRTPRQLLLRLTTIERRGLRAAARRYRNFPLYTLPKAIADSLGSNLPLLLLAPAFDLATVGFIGMAFTLAYRPIGIICSSFNKVFYQHCAQRVNHRQLISQLCMRYAAVAVAVGLPLFAVLYFVLPQLCQWLLGTEWITTGYYIRLMLPWLLLALVSNTLNFIPDIFGQQRGLFFFSLLRLALQLGALVIGIHHHSAEMAMRLFFVAAAVVVAAQTVWFYAIVRRYEANL